MRTEIWLNGRLHSLEDSAVARNTALTLKAAGWEVEYKPDIQKVVIFSPHAA